MLQVIECIQGNIGITHMVHGIVVVGQQLPDVTQAGGDHFINGMGRVGGHLLLEIGDAQRLLAPEFPLIRFGLPTDHPEQGGFAGTITTDQADPLPLVDLEVDLL